MPPARRIATAATATAEKRRSREDVRAPSTRRAAANRWTSPPTQTAAAIWWSASSPMRTPRLSSRAAAWLSQAEPPTRARARPVSAAHPVLARGRFTRNRHAAITPRAATTRTRLARKKGVAMRPDRGHPRSSASDPVWRTRESAWAAATPAAPSVASSSVGRTRGAGSVSLRTSGRRMRSAKTRPPRTRACPERTAPRRRTSRNEMRSVREGTGPPGGQAPTGRTCPLRRLDSRARAWSRTQSDATRRLVPRAVEPVTSATNSAATPWNQSG